MELQLGLALPSNPIKGFDLNSNVYEPKEMIGLDPWNRCLCLSSRNVNEKKRSYYDAFELNLALPQTLPLSFWNNQPNEEDNPRNDGDGDSVVGWPPIKSWRKKLCYGGVGGAENDRTVGNGCGGGGGGGGGRGSNSTYVKVKMEGVGIARKVDLSLHHSYETLTYTLIGMFGKCRENAKAYKLTYQDREGDWLLAGDVPWRTFIRSVQRLKLLRRSG